MTLSELQEQREQLLKRLTGTRSVTVEGRSVTYDGPSEVVHALREFDKQIASATTPNESRVFTIQSNRGI